MIQFTLLWQLDLTCLLDELRIRRSGWKRKLFARHAALVVYEAFEDSAQILDGQIREILQHYDILDRLEGELIELRGGLSVLSKQHSQNLGRLRNLTIAHRDHDVDAQLEFLRSLDTRELERLGSEILSWNAKLYNFLDATVNAMTDVLGEQQGRER